MKPAWLTLGLFVMALASPGPALAQTVLPNATVGVPYSQNRGSDPNSFGSAVIAGAVPSGITVGETVISGTPGVSSAGTYNFTVSSFYPVYSCDPAPCDPVNQSISYTLTVQPAPVTVPTLGEWTLFGLTGLLALFGVCLVIRRRTA